MTESIEKEWVISEEKHEKLNAVISVLNYVQQKTGNTSAAMDFINAELICGYTEKSKTEEIAFDDALSPKQAVVTLYADNKDTSGSAGEFLLYIRTPEGAVNIQNLRNMDSVPEMIVMRQIDRVYLYNLRLIHKNSTSRYSIFVEKLVKSFGLYSCKYKHMIYIGWCDSNRFSYLRLSCMTTDLLFTSVKDRIRSTEEQYPDNVIKALKAVFSVMQILGLEKGIYLGLPQIKEEHILHI